MPNYGPSDGCGTNCNRADDPTAEIEPSSQPGAATRRAARVLAALALRRCASGSAGQSPTTFLAAAWSTKGSAANIPIRDKRQSTKFLFL
jgi:hypothetical protein